MENTLEEIKTITNIIQENLIDSGHGIWGLVIKAEVKEMNLRAVKKHIENCINIAIKKENFECCVCCATETKLISESGEIEISKSIEEGKEIEYSAYYNVSVPGNRQATIELGTRIEQTREAICIYFENVTIKQ